MKPLVVDRPVGGNGYSSNTTRDNYDSYASLLHASTIVALLLFVTATVAIAPLPTATTTIALW